MELIYLDPGIVVCRKEPGMDSEKDVPEALKGQLGGEIFPIHRLDKGVGGLMAPGRTYSGRTAGRTRSLWSSAPGQGSGRQSCPTGS